MDKIVELRKAGKGSWAWQRRFNGKRSVIGIGTDQRKAEEVARVCNQMHADGADIEAVKKKVAELTYDPLAGLRKASKGSWAWQRRFNGSDYKIGIGTDQRKAEELARICNQMLDDGADIEAVKKKVAELTYDPLAGLRKASKGSWAWQRRFNGGRYKIGVGTDQRKAEELARVCNQMFDDGADLEAIRHRVLELQVQAAIPDTTPHQPADPNIKPAIDWLIGAPKI